MEDTCERNGLIIPGEGCFSEAHKIDMLRSLLNAGYPHMFVADEFGFERKLHYVQDVIDKNGEVELATAHENWYTPKNEILYTAHWDSFYTMLCSDKKTVESIVERYKFEGFYCNEKTKIYWSLYQ